MCAHAMDGRAGKRLLLKFILIACLLCESTLPARSAAGLECLIVASRRDGKFVLKAIVRSHEAVSGTYRLALVKRNAGGTSQTIQQGQFDLRASGESPVAITAFEAAAEGHVTASLALETDRGTVRCRFPE